MNPISASFNSNYAYNHTPSFGKVTKISYVVVDGHTESDKEIVEDVAKHFVKQIKSKQIKEDIKKLDVFETDEIDSIYELILALNKCDFFDYTRLSLSIFALANPTNIYDHKQK